MSVGVEIKIESKRLEAYLKKAPEVTARALSTAILKGTLMAEGIARRTSPHDTGRLASSIFTEIRPLFGKVETDTEYAIFVHDGTRFIRARPWMKQAAEQIDLDDIIKAELNALD